jgi:6-phosphogluconate dehydrogenase
MIGLGRMGASMVRRVMSRGHECVVQDAHPAAVAALVVEGATGAATLAELAAKMRPPRAIWMMVPAAVVDGVLADLVKALEPGDIVIDGGNSWYRDDIVRRSSSRRRACTTSTSAPAAAVAGASAATA